MQHHKNALPSLKLVSFWDGLFSGAMLVSGRAWLKKESPMGLLNIKYIYIDIYIILYIFEVRHRIEWQIFISPELLLDKLWKWIPWKSWRLRNRFLPKVVLFNLIWGKFSEFVSICDMEICRCYVRLLEDIQRKYPGTVSIWFCNPFKETIWKRFEWYL